MLCSRADPASMVSEVQYQTISKLNSTNLLLKTKRTWLLEDVKAN